MYCTIPSICAGGCSHGRSIEYFIESINNGGFASRACSSWEDYEAGACDGNARVNMGMMCTSSPGEGGYYLGVNEDSPFSQG